MAGGLVGRGTVNKRTKKDSKDCREDERERREFQCHK